MKDYASYSFWLETCGDDLTPRAPLDGSIDVDVAILGAGYTGLWTAYYLLKQQPSLRVAIVEREIAGFGASGRNGGWCTSGFPVTASELERRYGHERMRWLLQEMRDTVDEVGRVVEAEGIDAEYVKGGTLRLARGPHQLQMMEETLRTYERLGLAEHYTRLDAVEASERVRITKLLGALYSPHCAVIHPGKLVRGLARVVERLGGTIYEQTAVTDFHPRQPGVAGSRPRLVTNRGEVRADVVVLCGEAYLSQLPKLRRQLIPVYSLIVLTEPLSDAQWAEIGWEGRETLGSHRFGVDYLARTQDGRIVFGGRGAPYHFGSRIEDAFDRHGSTHQMLQEMTREWFPMLRDVRFTHHWGGPLGMPRDWMPTMSYDAQTGIATARGYTGQGVATANLSGRVLTALICDVQTPLRLLPQVGHRSPNWEPEPLRWLGVRYVQRGFFKLDEQAERTGRAPSGRSLVERLGRH